MAWQTLIYSANTMHNVHVKVGLGLTAAVAAIYMTHASTLYTVADIFPTIFGATGTFVLLSFLD